MSGENYYGEGDLEKQLLKQYNSQSMSKSSQINRQIIIIRKLISETEKGNYISKSTLIEYLEKALVDSETSNTSIPTIDRDIKAIKEVFNIPIMHSNKDPKGYYIENDFNLSDSPQIQCVLESFEILSSLNNYGGMPDFVIPEKRKSAGTEHFSFISSAISKQKHITFNYFKYDTNSSSIYTISPFALKESKNRWYVIGFEKEEKQLKAFGLDRIADVYFPETTFKDKTDSKVIIDYYSDCFAMFTSDEKPEKIVLSFDSRDSNYIKSFPIHHSQKLIQETENGAKFELHIQITLDFIMELMSRAWSVEVIEPLSLRKELNHYFVEASKRNS